MVDVELMVYPLLNENVSSVVWSTGYPQSFDKIDNGIGCIIQQDNSVKTTTSSAIDRISSIAVQIQTWAKTPERRNELDSLIDTQLTGLGLKRGTPGHLTETQPNQTTLYRSILLYSGSYDNKMEQIYL